MSTTVAVWLLIGVAVIAANLPWLSERFLFVLTPRDGTKRFWMRLAEWFLLYLVVGAVAFGLEQKAIGSPHAQDWEFYAVTLCLFVVFALPGFIYRHDLRHHLLRR